MIVTDPQILRRKGVIFEFKIINCIIQNHEAIVLNGSQIDRQIESQMDRKIDRQRAGWIKRQIKRQIDRELAGQKDR